VRNARWNIIQQMVILLSGWICQEEATMIKTVLVSFAVLTLATSAALAAKHKTTHHAAKPAAAAPASPALVFGTGVWGGVSSADRALYIKNQRDSGLNLRAR
jgi:hypothetical protein